MIYFFIIGFLVIASVYVLPESLFSRNDIDRKKVVFAGFSALSVGLLIFVFHNFWFLSLLAVAIFIYYKFIK